MTANQRAFVALAFVLITLACWYLIANRVPLNPLPPE